MSIKMAHQIEGHAGESVVSVDELNMLLGAIDTRARVCEVGTYHGSTCRYLAEHKPEALFLCIDNFWRSKSPGMVDNWMVNATFNMNLFVGTFQEFLVFAPQQQFHLIFVDASHTEEDCFSDLETARLLLLPGGILAAHDYEREIDPGVTVAIDRFCLQYQNSIVKRVDNLVFIG